jgi:hypothetical protein
MAYMHPWLLKIFIAKPCSLLKLWVIVLVSRREFERFMPEAIEIAAAPAVLLLEEQIQFLHSTLELL